MSESFPHFYCDTCSNAIHREADRDLVYQDGPPSQELLERIVATLPECPCGGKFKPGANPKCPHCQAEFAHQHEPLERLVDPHILLLNGACLFRDQLYSYQVVIGSEA